MLEHVYGAMNTVIVGAALLWMQRGQDSHGSVMKQTVILALKLGGHQRTVVCCYTTASLLL
jgi:hypothetical protein